MTWRHTAISAEGEGRNHLEANGAGAEGVEQFRRQLAEAQPLPDMPFGGAEAGGDILDRRAGLDERRHGDELVRRVHRGAHRIFHQRGFDRGRGFLDEARDRMIGVDDAFGGEFLQDRETAAAGIDFVDAFAVDRQRVDNQVLQDALGADAGLERGILGGSGRCFADIGRGKDELTERDVAHFAAGGHGWGLPATGGREPFSRPGKPVTNPLSALFLSVPPGPLPGLGEGAPLRSRRQCMCGGFRSGIAVTESEQIVGRFGGGARRADDGAVVFAQDVEPGAEIIGVAHRRHDRQCRADEGAAHFGHQFFARIRG